MVLPTQLIRGLTEENTQLGIKSPIGYFKSPIGDFFFRLGIGDMFSDSALPDSYIPNPQLDILSPIGGNMPNWGYFLLVLYYTLDNNNFDLKQVKI